MESLQKVSPFLKIGIVSMCILVSNLDMTSKVMKSLSD